jgi:hypothetical protein
VGNCSRISFAEGIFDAFLGSSKGSAQLSQSTIPTSKAPIPTLCPLLKFLLETDCHIYTAICPSKDFEPEDAGNMHL